jgi:hypothetical protein
VLAGAARHRGWRTGEAAAGGGAQGAQLARHREEADRRAPADRQGPGLTGPGSVAVTVILYTCPGGKAAASWHPCGIAAKALDDAGHTYEHRRVRGGRLMFWTWSSRARDRAEIKRLSGRRTVPILVLDDGDVVAGSGSIARWARANAPRSGERAD